MSKVEFIGKNDWTYIVTLISVQLSKYVKAVEGKGLSTNDFTTDLLNKLNGIDMSKYSTTEQMNSAITSAIAGITGIKFVKVNNFSELPEVGENGAIYLVPNGGTAQNVSDEYFWDGSKYELFGTTEIDLSDYLKSSDVVEMSTSEVKAVWDSVFGA